MSQLIASTYEIGEKIGSDGIGDVYLGRHIRLNMPVVLREEERTLTTNCTELRQEADILKSLHHACIPRVYDFVVDDDIVYTVMEYFGGESLDMPLRRGERIPQSKIIDWACQLLDALCYLHAQPPYGILHGNIKPKNIILTPQGGIRLVNFAIALTMVEEGAVPIGYSRRYASPEHYGIDYTNRRNISAKGETVLVDVRSDIYSLGATLYHLLTGEAPAEDAKDVQPIRSPDVSPAVAAIIQKAMMPNPDERYQTAREMLDALENFRYNDSDPGRNRRRVRMAAAALTAGILAGGAVVLDVFGRKPEKKHSSAIEKSKERLCHD